MKSITQIIGTSYFVNASVTEDNIRVSLFERDGRERHVLIDAFQSVGDALEWVRQTIKEDPK